MKHRTLVCIGILLCTGWTVASAQPVSPSRQPTGRPPSAAPAPPAVPPAAPPAPSAFAICQTTANRCMVRCHRKAYPTEAYHCRMACQNGLSSCNAEAAAALRQKEYEDEGGTRTLPVRPAGTPVQPPACQPPQVRYNNGTCGCPSGTRGANCDELIVH
jgi:hypothetical protein